MPVNLHPHQEVAVEKMHNGCVLYGGVGVGKSITAMAYFVSKVCGGEYGRPGTMKTPKDIYIITTAKKRDSLDWEVEAGAFGIFSDMRKSMENIKITVDSWNNIKDYVEVENAFFIFDEQRVVGYGAWSRAFIKIARANEWILLSATPGDTWLDYIPVFIANGWYKHKTDFLDQHVIWTPRVKYPKVLRYQNTGVLVRRRNEVLIHMPYERHTKRHAVDVWCDYDHDLFDKAVKKRWHVYENRPLRDVSELFGVMRKVVNSDASRLRALFGLMEKHPKLIVFYNFDYELELLRTLGQDGLTEQHPSTGDSLPSRSLSSDSDSTLLTPRPTVSMPKSKSSEESRSQKSGSPSTTQPLPSSDEKATTHVAVQHPSTCKGHWTVDRGMGEAFLTCAEWSRSVEMATTEPLTTDPSNSGSLGSGTPKSLSTDSKQPVNSSTGTALSASASTGESTTLPMSSSSFAVAEWNGHKHEPIPATARWVYLVQYRAGAEGWNCVETDAICFYSQTYSYRDWWQAHGRIDRLNTLFTDLYYYHLISRSPIDKAIRAALKAKKTFNEKDLKI